jgi:hypothetical protein
MKKVFTILFLLCSFLLHAQDDYYQNVILTDSLLDAGEFTVAYPILIVMEQNYTQKDTIYEAILSNCIYNSSILENDFRFLQKFDSAIEYGLDALKYLKKGEKLFDKEKISKS